MPLAKAAESKVRHLVVVLGDQLNRSAAAFDGFDGSQDLVWMAEVAEESTHVWSSKQRIAMFLAAMRHFAEGLREERMPLRFRRLDDPENRGTLRAELAATLADLRPRAIIATARQLRLAGQPGPGPAGARGFRRRTATRLRTLAGCDVDG